MNHPTLSDLALHAGRDLGWFAKLRVDRHLRGCQECRRETERFMRERRVVRELAPDIPASVNWETLAGEMRANVRLGLAAAECIAHTPARRGAPAWRMAAVTAGVAVFLAGGWWVQRNPVKIPAPVEMAVSAKPKDPAGTILRATMGGVGVERDGHALTLTHAGRPTLTAVSAGTQASVNARYIDEETGQVTIHHVYSE